ncbi:unnamed protein product [Macrosiphum euphorbiae]|uniref:CCZ1/INTU/HPS4 third Longin domain-containing protein n=1 Tax=Macrosiphum euphorbiae TaxID=13131 RepID=A0AAV0XLD8_9HEMI|nr:unnamed protein product [Macrosiphum euphorbiae]
MLANNKQSSFQLKKPEIISILKHKNDITSNSQILNDSRQLDSCSETSLTSSGAPSTEDSMYVQGPVFGCRAERMMKASSIEWSDNSEDEYTVSDGSRSVDMTDVIKNLPDENEINEIGVLFQIPTPNTDSPKKSSMITFWVMGRLFKEPNKRELYVCYEEGIPQNMVEIAFKLGTNYATG